jgi:hypothetical protein
VRYEDDIGAMFFLTTHVLFGTDWCVISREEFINP